MTILVKWIIAGIDWIVVGSDDRGRKAKKLRTAPEWAYSLVEQAHVLGIPAFMKEDLVPIVGEANMVQEFPRKRSIKCWRYRENWQNVEMNGILIGEVETKNIMTKSSLPVGGYSVNPYVGCTHACKYCYASFMKRFTGHMEEWGTFLDVKHWPKIKNPKKFAGQRIVIGSVTDGYNPQEGTVRQYQKTAGTASRQWRRYFNLHKIRSCGS